jgi:transposase-like protein
VYLRLQLYNFLVNKLQFNRATPERVELDYSKAIDEIIAKKELQKEIEFSQNKYLNNMVKPNHREIKG